MASFSNLGIILTSVFGIIILGLVAELYYFLWWKKKSNKNTVQKKKNHSKWLLSFLFWRKSPISAVNEEQSSTTEVNGHKQEKEEDLEAGNDNVRETLMKESVEESVESELIRLHNLCGPPRFLFTIKEETKEDLMEYEDSTVNGSIKGCCSSRSRTSLNDLILSPLSSPPIKKMAPLQAFNHHGFNPLFESLNEKELNYKLRSSPPPKFKFLRDADEKLIKRLVEEAEKRGCFQDSEKEKDASFIAFLNLNKEKEREIHQQQHVSIQNSSTRKVLPL